ncbi:flagellin [Consotaella salsifontis]|uniref:Flagellin n=1 Tax=Consotaella salsifontis TaxID=1365950 RepID=A0A1T4NRW0_9HYPH|nr:flagellin [Consotaella salsifontis]SJZ81867.1 Flagellin FlgL [Consotaella salsifontis]
MTSVLYNAAATTALRVLQSTNSKLDTVENRISTGLKIGEAKDNAAYWSISTTLKSDNAAMSSVSDALGLGAATVDTAYTGLNNALGVLNSIKEKLTSATQDGVDRAAVQDEINALQDQLESVATSSSFSGENWLSVNSSVFGYSANKSVVSSFTRDASNSVSIGTISIDTSALALYDVGGGSGILDSETALTDSAGNYITYGGNAGGTAPATSSLNFSGVSTGAAAGSNAPASVSLGTLNMAGVTEGDSIEFALTVDGSAGTVKLSTNGLTAANFEGNLQTAVNNAVGAGKATVTVDATTKEVKIETVSTGGAAAITVGATQAVNGDASLSALGGLLTSTSLPAPDYGAATEASATIGSFATAALATNDTFSFKLQYGANVVSVTHTFSAPELAAFSAANNPTESELAGLLQTDIDTALAGVTGYNPGDVTISGVDASGTFTFTTANKGADQSVGAFDFAGTGGAAARFGMPTQTTAVGSTGVVGYGTSEAAELTIGTFDNTGIKQGDRISFDLNVNGSIQTITVDTAGLTGVNPADLVSDGAKFQTRVQAALDAVFTGADRVVFTVDSGTQAMKLKTVAEGDTKFIAISNVGVTDGDGATTAKAGLTTIAAPTTANGSGSGTATVAELTSATAFSGSQTFGADDTLTINFKVNGTADSVTIDKAAVMAANGGSATIADATQYAAVLDSVMNAKGVTVTADGSNNIVFTKNTAAGVGTLEVTGVTSNTSADTMSVAGIDINSTDFKALTKTQQSTVMAAYISVVNKAIGQVTAAASAMGAVASRIDLQKGFVTDLMDTIDKGVSGLVDADMNEESTRLQALQVQQQLGVQALSIANQSAQNVLRLFQ